MLEAAARLGLVLWNAAEMALRFLLTITSPPISDIHSWSCLRLCLEASFKLSAYASWVILARHILMVARTHTQNIGCIQFPPQIVAGKMVERTLLIPIHVYIVGVSTLT